MGHHIDSEGRFQSDKYPDLAPDKIILSLKDPYAFNALKEYANHCNDRELANDIMKRLQTISEEVS